MHELSIALGILEIVEEQAILRNGSEVASVHVRLGPLSGVVKEALIFAFELARQSTAFEQCQIVIEQVPIVGYCERCQAARAVESIQQLCCAECGEPMPEITSGRELDICAMEFVDEKANAVG